MYYEVYLDSLFFINFVMNLCLLLLVNQSVFQAAKKKRLLLAAAVGAAVYLFPFLGLGKVEITLCFAFFAGTVWMLKIAFPIKTMKGFWKVLEKLIVYSFFLGGILLFFIRTFPMFRRYLTATFGITGIAILIYFWLTFCKEKRKKQELFYPVILKNEEKNLKILGLMDSGNSLLEPISGKPVSIIAENIFQNFWKEETLFFRVVPYHSIGKKQGILKAYLIPEILIEIDGIEKSFQDVYVAVSQEVGSVQMILNPLLLQKREKKNG